MDDVVEEEPSDAWAPADWCRWAKHSPDAPAWEEERCLTHGHVLPVGQTCPDRPELMKQFHTWFYFHLNKLNKLIAASGSPAGEVPSGQ